MDVHSTVVRHGVVGIAVSALGLGALVGPTPALAAPPAPAPPAAAACRPSVTVLPLPAGATSGAVSAAVPGLAVGSVTASNGNVQAMRWTLAGGRWRARPIAGLPATTSRATGVDASGDIALTFGPIVGTSIDPEDPPSAAVFADGAVHVLADGAGGTAAFATGVNDAGQVVGAAIVIVNSGQPHPMQAAVRWDDWTQPPVVLQGSLGYPSSASGIDDAGNVAGTDGNGGTHGFYARRWGSDGLLQPLTVGSNLNQPTFGRDVNESGRTVGTGMFTSSGSYRLSALVWDGAKVRVLPPIGPDDIGAEAVAVSASGVVVGTVDRFGVSGSRVHRVLFWTSGKVRSLLPASGDWTDPAQAAAVDSLGTVYGASVAATSGPLLPTVWTCASRQAFVPVEAAPAT